MDDNPYQPPHTEPARKCRGLGRLFDQLDDSQRDWLLLAVGLFVVAPLVYFLFHW